MNDSLQVGWKWKEVDDESFWRIPNGEVMALIYYLGKDPSKIVYDLGCGLGRHTVYFAAQGYQVYASDISAVAVKETKAWLAAEGLSAVVEQGKMTTIKQPSETFDLVVSFNVIYHAYKKNIEKAITEIYRILKPGGLFFGTFLSKNPDSPFRSPEVAPQTIIKYGGVEDGIPHFISTKKDVLTFLKDFEFLYLNCNEYFSPSQLHDEHGSIHYHFLVQKSE
ncbi:class I SAM-dependent methyltransferase [Candidatus Heimdallarchaeota archaeon]|nr:MAG: class I SAM-dependent methyltransferase [Candidatus Heimdallarchaeota archaeon]